jgi:CheY-like chemotaxis protein
MASKLTVHVVDDSRTQADIMRALLEKAGHHVIISTSGQEALAQIACATPDCVIFDLMMPGVDGYELCRRLRSMPELASTRLVVVSSKAFPFERRRALEMGADAYFVKPLSPATFDALTAEGRTRLNARVLISHPHWDHINTIPFFVPFYMQGNSFEVCGPSHGDITMRGLISAQMDGVYFPITTREFAADVQYRDLAEGNYDIGGVRVRTMLLSHPGNCLGYRLEYAGRQICYVTDNELYPKDSPFRSDEYVERLIEFCRDVNVLITDCTYTDAEYERHIHWGHSSVSQVAELAWRARVRALYLVHHDPGQNDDAIDAKLAHAKAWLADRGASTTVVAPVELAKIDV